MLELWTLCTALPHLMIFPYMKFHFNSRRTSGVIVRTKWGKIYQQRAITQEILMLELWTLCTALPPLMIFPYMKFHFNSSSRSGVIVRTRSVTDRQTDYRHQTTLTKTICLPHINMGGDIIKQYGMLQRYYQVTCLPAS